VPIFYDPMISKLVAWAEDRPSAIARMRRALGEYIVGGIKTTIPFFSWLLDEPDFRAGAFDTTYLDEALKRRNGRSFVALSPVVEEVAAIAAAVHALLAADSGTNGAAQADGGSARRWKARARAESLG